MRKVVLAAAFMLPVAIPSFFVDPASAENRWVRVCNNSGATVRELYGSRASTDSWEEDVLHEKVLPARSCINVNWNDGTGACIFDIKAVFNNGRSPYVVYGVNVCRVSDLNIR